MTDERELQFKKPSAPKVVPAAPSHQVQVPKAPRAVENPLLVARRSAIPMSCAKCSAPVHRKPSSVPFQGGPHQGGFLCQECWILEWADNPEIAADAPTRQWFAEEAARIRTRRAGGSEVLYHDGVNKAYLTPRGTVLIDLAKLPFGSPDEYDPGRFSALMGLFRAVSAKVNGYEIPPIQEALKPPDPAGSKS